MNKIIFLDIDGVLNTDASHRLPSTHMSFPGSLQIALNQLDKNAIANLNKITDATGAKIVISSTWRASFARAGIFPELCSFLKQQGVTGSIIGYTPTPEEYRETEGRILFAKTRGQEIALWLDQNPGKYDSYIAIDDDPDIDPVRNRWVQTYWDEGITSETVAQAIDFLSKPL